MNWRLTLEYLLTLAGAFALAVPIGWEREGASRGAGLRTFPLVAAASCAFVLLGRSFTGDTSEPHADAHARLIAGLMQGIGFIGGGAILKSRQRVHGTATAAGIWMTGALGAAAGHGRWELAIVASLMTFATLRWLTRVERRLTHRGRSLLDPDGRRVNDEDEGPSHEQGRERNGGGRNRGGRTRGGPNGGGR